MLTLEQIQQQYPENLRVFKRGLLREYLQYKILEIIFASEYVGRISFLGGTALRLIYGNLRFSEDLDFDNFGITEQEFKNLSEKIKIGLELQGLKAEMKVAGKNAYRCNIRLPEILFANKLSAYQEEKILIQVDSFAHNFRYKPDKKNLNKFGMFLEVFVTPTDILLSQKIYASLGRKRAKGRDFYDIVFLLAFTKPNYEYLKEKVGIDNPKELKEKFLLLDGGFDFEELARDVEPFLFSPSDSKRVKLFIDYIKQAEL